MKPYIILQARTGSTRLPEKMVIPFHDGKGVLEILLGRLLDAREELGAAGIMVATTTNPSDDAIATVAAGMGVEVFRGSESDVLSRFIGAAEQAGADKIIRICADNVFLDLDSLRKLIRELDRSEADYVSFRTEEGRPSILTHYGFFAEGVRTDALRKASRLTDEPLYHEHVTNYIYTHPEDFRVALHPISAQIPGLESHPDLRLTLDTADDFETQRRIMADFAERGENPTPAALIRYLDEEHPEMYSTMHRTITANSK